MRLIARLLHCCIAMDFDESPSPQASQYHAVILGHHAVISTALRDPLYRRQISFMTLKLDPMPQVNQTINGKRDAGSQRTEDEHTVKTQTKIKHEGRYKWP